ncbi:Uncharacterized conserved protein, DUF58 family, contains vWF domain [Amycolatopsis marina]|uniref:Uncharacterized conserved protein, DUF58 family, contains vWF domain n=1 Tax=Amycolatopsis marina TaxID=490629 RepID=A0A1I1AEX8_9PSEU|nr:DUF58 domain-containing protein [Amycolatopsis marina]SFB35926.1 Uncharacterized conserved protein, DUF58 family, contains vWF domain [Amycolatopsis marina]
MRRITPRGLAVLVLAALLLAGGHWGGYPLLWTLGAVLLGAVVAAVLFTARGIRVAVHRSVYPDRVERGRPALARLQVSNPAGKRQAAFLATDGVSGGTETVRVRGLQPGGKATYHYELATTRRGKVTVGPLTLLRVDAFGLARNHVPTGETTVLWVYPRKLPARALVGGHPRHHHEGNTTDDGLRGSVDLKDVREYVPGDEVRHLHWKATARTGRLMVRDLADPQQPRFTLVLDDRAGALPSDDFEEAVDVAAALLSASALAGQHSRLVTSSGLDVPTSGGAPATRRLLDELCELGQTGEHDAAVVPAALSVGRGSGGCLVVVTSGTAELNTLSLVRRRFGTILLIALSATVQGQSSMAGARVLGAATAAEAVRRWNEVAG